MYLITGVSGQTGAAAASALLNQNVPVRVVVRDPAKGETWKARGAEVAVADLHDSDALARAMDGVAGAYVLNPPLRTAPDMVAEAAAVAASIRRAVELASLPKLVVLSSTGSHLTEGLGNIFSTRAMEQGLGGLSATATTFLRAALFLDNFVPLLGVARAQGVLPSVIQPVDRAQQMVSSLDIGRRAAAILLDPAAPGLVELAGPVDYSPNDVATAVGAAMGRNVQAVPIPPDQWETTFIQWGFSPRTVELYAEMTSSANAGRLPFEFPDRVVRGSAPLSEVVAGWLAR